MTLTLKSARPDARAFDLRELPRRLVRRHVRSLLQEPFLYSKSVSDNVRLGRQGASHDDVLGATRAAAVHDEVAGFEDGYDTLIGERGVRLSGGQRQRLSLARGLLHDTTVLILDDALSAVDSWTEQVILDALAVRRGRLTTVVIAHRLSTLARVDRIAVLDHGRLVETGTHAELIARGGPYARLWSIQTDLEQEIAFETEETAS